MLRKSIDVTTEKHQRLKAMAALQGKSFKEHVIERTPAVNENPGTVSALAELETLLDRRIRGATNGTHTKRTVGNIFKSAYREHKTK